MIFRFIVYSEFDIQRILTAKDIYNARRTGNNFQSEI